MHAIPEFPIMEYDLSNRLLEGVLVCMRCIRLVTRHLLSFLPALQYPHNTPLASVRATARVR